jgi:hypothetical protein
MRPIGTFAVGLALLSGTAVVQAQTAVTRQITSEPVETVITEGPNGTAVTRRILTPEPGVSTYAAPPFAYQPAPVEALAPQYVEPAAPAPRVRRATVTTATTATPARTRAATTRQASAQPARTVTRTVTAAPTMPAPTDRPLVLSPAQRQVIYRTVAQREFYPPPAVVPVRPPVVAQTEVYAPPPVAGYPLRTVYPGDDVYGYRDYGYRDYAYGPDPYRDQDYRDPYHTAYRWNGVPLVVGARIPASVPLVAVPESVAFRIPAAQAYSYAVIDNRVYLVDPSTDVIVAEITP